MALLWGDVAAAVCAVIKLPPSAQWKITVSSILPLRSTDSWSKDTSLPFNKFISSRPSLLSLLFFCFPYFLFFSVVQPGCLCADSNAKLALPPAVSSIDLLLLGREWQAVRKTVKWRNVTGRRFGGEWSHVKLNFGAASEYVVKWTRNAHHPSVSCCTWF